MLGSGTGKVALLEFDELLVFHDALINSLFNFNAADTLLSSFLLLHILVCALF